MPIKARVETPTQLTDEDKAVLKAMYTLRTLNEPLLQEFFFGSLDDGQNDYTLERIRWYVDEELLDIDEMEDGECSFYLTNRGLQTARTLFDQPLYTIDKKTGHKVYDVTAQELRVAPHLLDHQLHLNALALDIMRRCGLSIDCYKDSKGAANFRYAQPDGVFELPHFDILLEMDMAHERKAELARKWTHYRNYLSSRDYYLRRDKKLIVLFATENIKRSLSYRKRKVLESVWDGLPDLIGDRFEVYIGPSAVMAEVAERLILPTPDNDLFQQEGAFLQRQLGFMFSRPAPLIEAYGPSVLYMRKMGGNGQVLIQDGRPQEFLLESYLDEPVSVLKRAASYPSVSQLVKDKVGREIPVLILARDEQSVFQGLKAIDALGTEQVYLTTGQRLRERPFAEALFQFDKLGKLWHFNNLGLNEKIYERMVG